MINVNSLTTAHNPQTGFDLIRLSKSKELVDICSNTIRSYHRQGLPIYKQGKAAYVSKTELAQFIRQKRDTNLEVA